ncbi:MAG: hypothetical protein ACTHLY_02575 [Pseudolabrys sp.]
MIDDRNGFWPRVVDVPPDLSDPKLVNRRGALPPRRSIRHRSGFAP